MSEAIRVDHIINRTSRLKHTELRGMIRLEQIRVKTSGEKRGRSERSTNIKEREKIRAKRKNKSLVRISERRVKK